MKKILIGLMTMVMMLSLTGTARAFTMVELIFAIPTLGTFSSLSLAGDGSVDAYYRDVAGTYTRNENVMTSIEDISYNSAGIDGNVSILASKDSESPGQIDLYVYTIDTSDLSVTYHSLYNDLADSNDLHISKTLGNFGGNDHLVIGYRDNSDNTIKLSHGVATSYTTIDTSIGAAGDEILDIRTIGNDVAQVAYYDSSAGTYEVFEWSFTTGALSDSYSITSDIITSDIATYGRKAVLSNAEFNSEAVLVYQQADHDLVASYYNGATRTEIEIDGDPTGAVQFDADELTIDTTNEAIVAYIDESANVIESTIELDAGSTTNSTIATGVDNDNISVGGFKTESETVDMSRIGYVKSGDQYAAIETTSGSFDNENIPVTFDQQGDSVPELPANNLWKVLIAVLSLGLVVGIAAFMKKKKK